MMWQSNQHKALFSEPCSGAVGGETPRQSSDCTISNRKAYKSKRKENRNYEQRPHGCQERGRGGRGGATDGAPRQSSDRKISNRKAHKSKRKGDRSCDKRPHGFGRQELYEKRPHGYRERGKGRRGGATDGTPRQSSNRTIANRKAHKARPAGAPKRLIPGLFLKPSN